MQYQIPPDVLHYEPRLLFGLTAQDIMVIGMGTLLGIQKFGIIGGLILGVCVFLGAVRFRRFGNLSIFLYLVRSAWYRYRPQDVVLPRVLPDGGSVSLTIYDWDGNERIRIGSDNDS